MQLPIDIPELLKISTDLKEVSKTPISVSVYIDDSANDRLIGHVRAAFASAGVHTRVTIGYMDSIPVQINESDDMVALVAGAGDYVGRQASNIRNAGIPVMVITDDPIRIARKAEESGFSIPEADIIAPERIGHKNPVVGMARSGIDLIASKLGKRKADVISVDVEGADPMDGQDGLVIDEAVKVSIGSDGAIEHDDAPKDAEDPAIQAGPIELTEASLKDLDERMGEWILAACSEKKLAMALSFHFVRRPLAYDSVVSTSMQNAAIGFVPLIPGADLPIMTLNQAKMVLQIAAAYDQPLDAARIKEIAAVVAGGFLFRNVARSLSKFIPGAGWVISGATGFVGTEAMGRAAIEYFEAGGDIVGLAKVVQSARDEATEVAKKAADTPAGQKVIDVARATASSAFSKIRNR